MLYIYRVNKKCMLLKICAHSSEAGILQKGDEGERGLYAEPLQKILENSLNILRPFNK